MSNVAAPRFFGCSMITATGFIIEDFMAPEGSGERGLRAADDQGRKMGRTRMGCRAVLLLGLMLAPVGVAAQAPAQHSGSANRNMETLKERLSDKASDEQRVNDCKVPPERHSRARRAECGDTVTSATHVKH